VTSALSNTSARQGGVDPISTKAFDEEVLVVVGNAITDDEVKSVSARSSLI